MKNTYSKTRHTFTENGETINAIVYGGIYKLDEAQANIIIEDLGEGNEHGRYMLTLGNDGWMSDKLEDLEPRLFEWMQAEGFEYDSEEQTKERKHKMKTYRLKASSIQNYEMLVKAENEDEAYEYASLHSGEWKSIHTDDWQDDGCEEVKP